MLSQSAVETCQCNDWVIPDYLLPKYCGYSAVVSSAAFVAMSAK